MVLRALAQRAHQEVAATLGPPWLARGMLHMPGSGPRIGDAANPPRTPTAASAPSEATGLRRPQLGRDCCATNTMEPARQERHEEVRSRCDPAMASLLRPRGSHGGHPTPRDRRRTVSGSSRGENARAARRKMYTSRPYQGEQHMVDRLVAPPLHLSERHDNIARAPTEKCADCVLSQWPGYGVWTRQRQARDDTHRRNPITLAKFAQQVGRCVGELLRVYCTEPRCCRQLAVLIYN
jgi:hypothetical protein